MFSDIVLERVLSDTKTLEMPVSDRSAILHKIYETLDELDLLKEGAKDDV